MFTVGEVFVIVLSLVHAVGAVLMSRYTTLIEKASTEQPEKRAITETYKRFN